MPDQKVILERPVRMAGLLFAGLVAFWFACCPFVEEVDSVASVLGGAAYCLFLTMFSAGLVLALPSRIVVLWWMLSGVIPLLFSAGFWLALRSDPEWIFRASARVFLRGLNWVIWGWLLTGCAVAGWGWLRFIRGGKGEADYDT